jgi:acylpyruvate hydrolase
MSSQEIIRNCKKVICVARNYVAHIAELNNKMPSRPMLFLKPTTSLLASNTGAIEIPSDSTELHHEVELGIVIGKGGRDIHPSLVDEHIKGYTLCLDMTDRRRQGLLKAKGEPWENSKAPDAFTPVGPFIAKNLIKNHADVNIWLKVNGVTKQNGNTNKMIFPIQYLISYISTMYTLEDGDLILSGTPDGVGPVKPGDIITAGIPGITDIKFDVVHRKAPTFYLPSLQEGQLQITYPWPGLTPPSKL